MRQPADTRVVILAGGAGTRLRPYTTVLPKPLMPIVDMPILEVVLRQLRHFGYRSITVAVNHLAELIRTFFGDGSKLGLDLDYCLEETPLGTAGPLALVREVTDPFLVLNGDLLTTLDFAAIVRRHQETGACATIGAFRREVHVDFGVLELDAAGLLEKYIEKPRLNYSISMGVNVFSRRALSFIPPRARFDIPALMMAIKAAGERVGTYNEDCEWLDIGRPDDYEEASRVFERNRTKYLHEQ
jgi:NDP-mannose synthase